MCKMIYVDSQKRSWAEWDNANVEIKLFSEAAKNGLEFMLTKLSRLLEMIMKSVAK